MRRRDLLKAAGASLGALAAPRIGRAERSNKLVFARRLLGVSPGTPAAWHPQALERALDLGDQPGGNAGVAGWSAATLCPGLLAAVDAGLADGR